MGVAHLLSRSESGGITLKRVRVALLVIGIVVVAISTLGALASDPRPVGLTVDYPLAGTIFPPDFTPPTFVWHDATEAATKWRIEVTFTDGSAAIHVDSNGDRLSAGEIDARCVSPTNELPKLTPEQSSAHTWIPEAEVWQQIKKHSVAHSATVTISGVSERDREHNLSRGKVSIQTSKDPVGAPIFYRDVPLMPSETEKGIIKPLAANAISLIQWRLRDVGASQSRIVLEGMHTCANCHSFSADGRTMGMDMDGPANDKGLYALAAIKPQMSIRSQDMVSWNPSQDRQFAFNRVGFMSQVSPTGEYVLATVSNVDQPIQNNFYVVNFKDYRFLQVFYPTRGILAWYSRTSGERHPLPGADDPRYVQTDGVWSPDGKYVVFARARAKAPYPADGKMADYANDPKEVQIQYDLYRVPFNEGKGGTPEPIAGASANSMSNTFPKVSPDGRWIVFVRCRNGQLMRPDSELYIVPSQGGVARRLRANMAPMNSWHSFSPNGRWLVFSSKRSGPYTKMYLTHIDQAGNDSPAVLIENSTAANRAVNLPEFVNIPPDGLVKISTPAVDMYRKFDEAVELGKTGKYEAAVTEWKEIAETNPDDAKVENNLGSSLAWIGKFEEAIPHYEKGLKLNPQYHAIHNNLGLALASTGHPDQAILQFRTGLQFYPESADLHNNLGRALAVKGQLDEATVEFKKALEISPDLADAQNNLGRVLSAKGQLEEATAQFEKAVSINPNLAEAQNNLGVALLSMRKLEQAQPHFEKAIEINPGFVEAHCYLGTVLYYSQGKVHEALAQWREALRLKPDDVLAMSQMAHALAASPEDSDRNPEEAIRLAERTVQLSDAKDAGYLDTLAMAYAAAGKFPEAGDTARRALELATQQNRAQLVEALNSRIRLYKTGQPYRDTRNGQ
jgi:tetratricopeptide (TPR) repeat protein